jgi:sec-independent protein translocase protein TatB
MGVPPTIEVANLGMADTLILMVLALVVFGPRRLPQIGRQVGKLMYEFRKASNDFKFQMEEELRSAEEADRSRKEEEERQRQLAANPPAQLEASVVPAEETLPAYPPDPYRGIYGEAAEATAATESAYPSIQPPSTGEPVPAAWPANETAETVAAEASPQDAAATAAESQAAPLVNAEQSPAENGNAAIETAVEGASTSTETVHNG